MKNLWSYRKGNPIPVIDLFAGPGGLGEGFSRAGNGKLFKTVLSVEMEKHAHSTLTLRAFQRALECAGKTRLPTELIEVMKGELSLDELYSKFPKEAQLAKEEALQMELGPENRSHIFSLIKRKLKEHGSPGRWILIGGPPCQAYSLAGRSRRSKALSEGTYKREEDKRHFLYEEYLKIIAEFEPAVFVMENVKGLLSSTVGGSGIFSKIRQDLENPQRATSTNGTQYKLIPLKPSEPLLFEKHSAKSFIVRSESCGVPQRRHRVIIVGVREDIQLDPSLLLLGESNAPSCGDTIEDLPVIRSGISRRHNSHADWQSTIRRAEWERMLKDYQSQNSKLSNQEMLEAIFAASGDLDFPWFSRHLLR